MISMTNTNQRGDFFPLRSLRDEQSACHFSASNSIDGQTSKYPSVERPQSDTTRQRTALKRYKSYLKERMRETAFQISGSALFKEVQSRGYRGSVKTVQALLTEMRKENCPTALLFHKTYLIERLKEVEPYNGLESKLFKEIQSRGYRGSLSALQALLKGIEHGLKTPQEGSLVPHKAHLLKRVKEIGPRVSAPTLFREIQAKGYLGTLKTVQNYLTVLRKDRAFEAVSLKFHKKYLIERIKGMSHFHYGLGSQLFKEIRERGYRGSLKTVQKFLRSNRRDPLPPEGRISFHEDYLNKRVTEAPSHITARTLFTEIQAKGYRGSFQNLRAYLVTLRKNINFSKRYLDFYKDYLLEKIEETGPDLAPCNELFEEIRRRGYRGSLRTVQRFLRSAHPRNFLVQGPVSPLCEEEEDAASDEAISSHALSPDQIGNNEKRKWR